MILFLHKKGKKTSTIRNQMSNLTCSEGLPKLTLTLGTIEIPTNTELLQELLELHIKENKLNLTK